MTATIDRRRIARARERADATFDPAAGGSREIVIFGTGVLGRRIAASARAAGLDVLAACDNNPARWHGDLCGVPILSPDDAVARFGALAVFVVAIYNPSSVVTQLIQSGCHRIATYPAFFWAFEDYVPGMSGLARPEALLANEDAIRAARAVLYDRASQREFDAQIAWRCSLDDARLPPPSPFAKMHFDRSVYDLSGTETLVDCGAFDGDSLRAFLGLTNGSFERAYALEPDPDNREKLETCVANLPAPYRAAVTVLPYAASDQTGTVYFDAGNGVASALSDGGEIAVPCRKLDDMIDAAPTLIKMDIEGAEPEALRGAARLIEDHRPVLAICAYHYNEHLWELPALLRELAPEARIVLRRYAEQCWETVYYAIPPGRCRLSSAS